MSRETNREIKFRAFYASKMWYVVQLKYGDDSKYFTAYLSADKSNQWDTYGGSHEDGFYLMQYTGLKDKNGKEVFEGDVVKCHDHPTGVEDCVAEVKFEDGCFRVDTLMPRLADYGTAWVEVIGNVYENPELLNKDHTP